MSAQRAARALLELDCSLAEFAAGLERYAQGRCEKVTSFVRENVLSTWTLTLAARSAGCSEEQVIAALLHLDEIRVGTSCVCRGIAAEMFRS